MVRPSGVQAPVCRRAQSPGRTAFGSLRLRAQGPSILPDVPPSPCAPDVPWPAGPARPGGAMPRWPVGPVGPAARPVYPSPPADAMRSASASGSQRGPCLTTVELEAQPPQARSAARPARPARPFDVSRQPMDMPRSHGRPTTPVRVPLQSESCPSPSPAPSQPGYWYGPAFTGPNHRRRGSVAQSCSALGPGGSEPAQRRRPSAGPPPRTARRPCGTNWPVAPCGRRAKTSFAADRPRARRAKDAGPDAGASGGAGRGFQSREGHRGPHGGCTWPWQ